MEHRGGDNPFVTVPVPDSEDSRLFIELSSYGADLAEAREALDLAIQGLEAGSPLADASQHLIGHAVIAYCRTSLHSNVRRQLTEHLSIPDGLLDLHDRMKAYRNATIAHSQSELAVTYAVGVLDANTLNVRDVAGPTVLTPLPNSVVFEFRALIDAIERDLGSVIEPVRARLKQTLTAMDRTSLVAAAKPEIVEKWGHEFNPRTKRSAYPKGHTQYWNSTAGGSTTKDR